MKLLRKIVVGAIGFPLLVIGVILIPLPGPGLVVCFLALLILSLEFEFVGPHLQKAKAGLKKIYDTAKARADKINKQ